VPAITESELIWQQCLFAFEEPAVDNEFRRIERTWLDANCWVDHAPGWLTGADVVFAELVARLPWRQREVVMFHRLLPEPRLTAWWNTSHGDDEALPVLAEARRSLTEHYARPFDSIGYNLYRNGRDSVAWHGDRERYELEDPTVVIVSVGAPRMFSMRPNRDVTHGRTHSWQLGHGDLFVMGGACQHDWQHSVPKSAKVSAPRLSIMFRHNLADLAEFGD
jgi:alkylated DNA repair dioxygenase AlkB